MPNTEEELIRFPVTDLETHWHHSEELPSGSEIAVLFTPPAKRSIKAGSNENISKGEAGGKEIDG